MSTPLLHSCGPARRRSRSCSTTRSRPPEVIQGSAQPMATAHGLEAPRQQRPSRWCIELASCLLRHSPKPVYLVTACAAAVERVGAVRCQQHATDLKVHAPGGDRVDERSVPCGLVKSKLHAQPNRYHEVCSPPRAPWDQGTAPPTAADTDVRRTRTAPPWCRGPAE